MKNSGYQPEGHKEPPTNLPTTGSNVTKPSGKSIYIFKVHSIFREHEYKMIIEQLKLQIQEGVLLLSPHLDFVGREIEIEGQQVQIKLIFADEEIK